MEEYGKFGIQTSGYVWNFIPMTAADSGRTITFRVENISNASPSDYETFYLRETFSIIKYILYQNNMEGRNRHSDAFGRLDNVVV